MFTNKVSLYFVKELLMEISKSKWSEQNKHVKSLERTCKIFIFMKFAFGN